MNPNRHRKRRAQRRSLGRMRFKQDIVDGCSRFIDSFERPSGAFWHRYFESMKRVVY